MPNPLQSTDWQLPPDNLALGDGDVHVWLIDAPEPTDNLAAHRDLLSPSELDRAAKFHFEPDRRLFVISHAAVRAILARYLNTPVASIEFTSGMNGKPSLAPAWAASGIEFNLSHSHGAALIAMARNCAVGVDIEFVKTDFAFEGIAERFFTPGEVSALRALPSALRRQAFYKCWTSKEALLKAKGTGLVGQLDEVEINRETGRILAAVDGWSLSSLDPGPGYAAALVSQGAPARISLYRWEP